MKRLTIRQAREALTHLDSTLAREGELAITRRGQPIARVLPVIGTRPMPSHRDLRARIARMRTGSELLVRRDRDER